LRPPADPAWEYVAGDVRDLDSISRAMAGIEALIYMALGLKDLPENSREEAKIYRPLLAKLTV
jgi:hypothetical protein